MEKKLIKIDRNGSKHYEGYVKCDRCGGDGVYKWGAMINGRPQYAGTCFKCGGDGKVFGKWIERTAEYEAKLAEKREAKWAAQQAKYEAERKAREEAEAKAKAEREAKIAAEKAKSDYIGTEGEKINVEAEYVATAEFEVPSFGGYGTQTMRVHIFKIGDSKLVWKTTCTLNLERGSKVALKATIKEHREYNGEKQTVLTRAKVA